MVRGFRKSSIIKLLSVLNYRYSLRDLQSLLGIPYQTLWKYISLTTMPEEETSRKILQRVEELKLIDKLVMEPRRLLRGIPT